MGGTPEALTWPVRHAATFHASQAVDSMGSALQDLHLSLGNAEAACAVAVARAQREQAAGNYKVTSVGLCHSSSRSCRGC